jgi:hypothetical protein
MANTYIQIGSKVTVGSGGSATIEFTSIPSTYTDLLVKVSGRTTVAGITTFRMKLNTDTGANYNYRQMQGAGSGTPSSSSGSSAASSANEVGLINGSDSTSSTFCNTEIYFPNYASSNSKSWSSDSVEEENATAAYIRMTAGYWTGTAAINAITFTLPSGSFAQHSTASLYGIKNS